MWIADAHRGDGKRFIVLRGCKADCVSGTGARISESGGTAQKPLTRPGRKSQLRAVYCAISIDSRPWLFPFLPCDAELVFSHLIGVPNLLLLRW